MARRDRKCLCCGAQYSYCPTCSVDKAKPTWMTEFCSESCKELFETATKYNLKKLTKSEAKVIIEKLELKERSAYVSCVQQDLENILAKEPAVKKEAAPSLVKEAVVKQETAPLLEEEPAVKKVEPILEEKPTVVKEIAPVVEEKPVFTPKKKQKSQSHEVVTKKENK